MPKSRSKRKPKAAAGTGHVAWGGPAGQGSKRVNVALAGVAVLAAIAAGVYGFDLFRNSGEFDALVAEGQGRLGAVVNKTNFGRGHLESGQSHAYSETFPTSGPHPVIWTEPGLYDTRQPQGLLVHALEHGNIVIHYDEPGDAVMATLEEWTARYDGQWNGLVATSIKGLGQDVGEWGIDAACAVGGFGEIGGSETASRK